MEKSVSIGQLAIALSKLQSEVQNLHKDKQGYGYKYTELASVLDASRPLCAKYELSVSQLCCSNDKADVVGVETILMHSSGEFISSVLYMPVQQAKAMTLAQCAGIVITYARRYALAAILGIAQTDNDGAIHEPDNLKSTVTKTATAPLEHKELFELLDKVKVAPTEQSRWLAHYKVTSFTQLTEAAAAQLVKALKEKLVAQEGAKKNGV